MNPHDPYPEDKINYYTPYRQYPDWCGDAVFPYCNPKPYDLITDAIPESHRAKCFCLINNTIIFGMYV